MSQPTPDYTLTANDTAAFRALLRAQGNLGPARQTPGQAQFWDFFAAIDSIVYGPYTSATNAQVKGWLDSLFPPLLSTKTCYGIDAAGMYVLYAYAQSCPNCWYQDDHGFYLPSQSCDKGFPVNADQTGGKWALYSLSYSPTTNSYVNGNYYAPPWDYFVSVWWPPALPADFYNALVNDVNTLYGPVIAAGGGKMNAAQAVVGGSTSAVLIFDPFGNDNVRPQDVQQFEQSRFDPANWTDAGTFVQVLHGTGLWQGQRDAVTALLQPDTLTEDAYYFLLHLLVALPTDDATSQQLAQRIASASATSPEYPNDTFINQLVYLALLHLADPLGAYGWDNAQLQAALSDLEGAILSADPASAAIKASLAQHGKVLYADASYPMQDPYTSIGFSQRKTDTLFALDKARAALNQ